MGLTDAISSTNMNPATFNGYDWNIATASASPWGPAATCVPIALFEQFDDLTGDGSLSTFGEAVNSAEDPSDDVNNQDGDCIQNCSKKGLDAITIYERDDFTG